MTERLEVVLKLGGVWGVEGSTRLKGTGPARHSQRETKSSRAKIMATEGWLVGCGWLFTADACWGGGVVRGVAGVLWLPCAWLQGCLQHALCPAKGCFGGCLRWCTLTSTLKQCPVSPFPVVAIKQPSPPSARFKCPHPGTAVMNNSHAN